MVTQKQSEFIEMERRAFRDTKIDQIFTDSVFTHFEKKKVMTHAEFISIVGNTLMEARK